MFLKQIWQIISASVEHVKQNASRTREVPPLQTSHRRRENMYPLFHPEASKGIVRRKVGSRRLVEPDR
jgi:hypothetical protein